MGDFKYLHITGSMTSLATRLLRPSPPPKMQEETVTTKSAPSTSVQKEPPFHASVAYLQSTNDTQLFDHLQEQGDYKRILAEAAEFDNGDAPDLSQTNKSPRLNRGDDLLDENDHYAVVHNANVGDTYEAFRKISESQVQKALTRYGLPNNATADVKEVVAKMPEYQEKELEEQSHGFRRWQEPQKKNKAQSFP